MQYIVHIVADFLILYQQVAKLIGHSLIHQSSPSTGNSVDWDCTDHQQVSKGFFQSQVHILPYDQSESMPKDSPKIYSVYCALRDVCWWMQVSSLPTAMEI